MKTLRLYGAGLLAALLLVLAACNISGGGGSPDYHLPQPRQGGHHPTDHHPAGRLHRDGGERG
jgi:hypothetical protein